MIFHFSFVWHILHETMPAVKTLWNEHVWQRVFKSRITFCDHYSAWNVAGDMIIPEGPRGTSCNRATKLCGKKKRKICPVQCALSASPYMIVWQTLDCFHSSLCRYILGLVADLISIRPPFSLFTILSDKLMTHWTRRSLFDYLFDYLLFV